MCRIQTNGRNLYDRMILILQAHATHQINRANACITANEWYHPAIFFYFRICSEDLRECVEMVIPCGHIRWHMHFLTVAMLNLQLCFHLLIVTSLLHCVITKASFHNSNDGRLVNHWRRSKYQ